VKPLLEAKSMDELVLLSEDEAVRVDFDSTNCRVLFRLTPLFALATVLAGLGTVAGERYLEASMAVVLLVVLRLLYQGRDRPAFSRYFRLILIAYLTVQLLYFRLLAFGYLVSPIEFLLPPLLLFFRLRWNHLVLPLGALWAVSSGRVFLATVRAGEPLPELAAAIPQTLLTLGILHLVRRFTENRRRAFLDSWRRESRRHHERRRMQEELGDARRIQLSMLPRRDPELPWLELAGISIPASEVGGDYFDYFSPVDNRQELVVADVAGHGVASGLLLSGIRSCLYLLQDSPLQPIEILQKLDRMVRQTSARRFFVTMLYASFDRDHRTLTFSAAGHPPLLHYRAAEERVEEWGLPCLPLGTALGSSLDQKTIPFDSGDVFLFYTDGIAETLDHHQHLYGADRLAERFTATATDRTAQGIRDALLGDVVTYKGDCPQTDDITLVVAKVP
jgi:serine phosphatase RsbU (regulator of sigma subunit)